MAIILNGKELSDKIKLELKEKVEILKKENIIPKLAVILVGDNSASLTYIKNKKNACEFVGIDFENYVLDSTISEEELHQLINKLNSDKSVTGILIQAPLPNNLDINKAVLLLDPLKDVDGFHPMNIGLLAIDRECLIPCTPKGIIRLLEEYNIEVEGQNIVVLGRSNIVGNPLGQLLKYKNATVTTCHSKTENLSTHTKGADIIISAIGVPNFLTADMISEKTVLVDVGINRTPTNTLTGDIDYDSVFTKASHITPVPGGVGPMTIAMLLQNTIDSAIMQKDK